MSIIFEKEESSSETLIHKLKLQWVTTGDDAEKRRISVEIRQRLQHSAEYHYR
jgi:hypothetical protein